MKIHLLYLTAEDWPTFRVDLTVLFGQTLPKYNVTADLVTMAALGTKGQTWSAGRTLLAKPNSSKYIHTASKLIHCLKSVWRADPKVYNAVQVRDMPSIGLLVLCICKLRRIPFIYWMSYPQSEGQIDRARARGPGAGLSYWGPLIAGHLGCHILYKWVLPSASHVFVQSDQMLKDVASLGIPSTKMTAVPMAVDSRTTDPALIQPSDDPRLQKKRVVAYLGTLDRARQLEHLLDAVKIVKKKFPDILLVLIGDAADSEQQQRIREQATQNGLEPYVIITGWLSPADAWRYVRAAEVAVSPFPRGHLLDSASPTKVMEYMALSLPVLANDNPDQKLVLEQSKAGICRNFDPESFAEGLCQLLSMSPNEREQMGLRGRKYIQTFREYAVIGKSVADTYHAILERK
jgi:glycosyltransferase involved in cell wall biosynthesis